MTVHKDNQTPQPALFAILLVSLLIGAPLILAGYPILDIIGWLGTLGTESIVVTYILVAIACPLYLRRRSELAFKNVAVAVLAVATMCMVLGGTVYPCPPSPYCWLPFICLAYLLAGLVYYQRSNSQFRVPSQLVSDDEKEKVTASIR